MSYARTLTYARTTDASEDCILKSDYFSWPYIELRSTSFSDTSKQGVALCAVEVMSADAL